MSNNTKISSVCTQSVQNPNRQRSIQQFVETDMSDIKKLSDEQLKSITSNVNHKFHLEETL